MPTAAPKRIVARAALQERQHAPGFRTAGLRSGEELDLDPFLNLDLFHMDRPIFPPHPHAGFSAVTVMLPESAGGFSNRDSLGDRSRIEPGAIHWTQAGRGMMHEEVPEAPGVDCWGFQIFVNLAAADKAIPPSSFHASAAAVPRVARAGASVRVLTGQFDGTEGALRGLALTPDLLDLDLAPGASLDLAPGEGRRAFAFVLSGSLAGAEESRAPSIVLFSDDGADVSLVAGAAGCRALFCAGVPLRQPVVWSGPFSMTSQAEAEAAMARFRRGEMGRLSPAR